MDSIGKYLNIVEKILDECIKEKKELCKDIDSNYDMDSLIYKIFEYDLSKNPKDNSWWMDTEFGKFYCYSKIGFKKFFIEKEESRKILEFEGVDTNTIMKKQFSYQTDKFNITTEIFIGMNMNNKKLFIGISKYSGENGYDEEITIYYDNNLETDDTKYSRILKNFPIELQCYENSASPLLEQTINSLTNFQDTDTDLEQNLD